MLWKSIWPSFGESHPPSCITTTPSAVSKTSILNCGQNQNTKNPPRYKPNISKHYYLIRKSEQTWSIAMLNFIFKLQREFWKGELVIGSHASTSSSAIYAISSFPVCRPVRVEKRLKGVAQVLRLILRLSDYLFQPLHEITCRSYLGYSSWQNAVEIHLAIFCGLSVNHNFRRSFLAVWWVLRQEMARSKIYATNCLSELLNCRFHQNDFKGLWFQMLGMMNLMNLHDADHCQLFSML